MTTNSGVDDLLEIRLSPDDATPIWKRLNIKQILFLLLSLSITVALWLLGSAADGTKFAVASEPLHDFAIFVFSLGFFDSLKEFVFKEDNEKQKKRLLDMTTSRFLREMDEGNNIRAKGLHKIRDYFDTAVLRSIILTLKPGDTLYCHDGSIADFSKLKEPIKIKAAAGVNFRFMALAPFCKNAQRRGDELDEAVEDYSSGCKKFATTIESIRTELADQYRSGEISDHDCDKRVKIKLYRSLMSIPFYLIVRNNKPTIAITGFYLRALSSSAIHLEWEAQVKYRLPGHAKNPDESKYVAEDSSLISALWDYWRYKWSRGCEEYERAKRLEGKWKYTSFIEDQKLIPIYMGECTIKEEAGSLRASGKRVKTRLRDENGGHEGDWEDTNIQWTTKVMHKYFDGDKLSLITSHECFPQQGEWSVKGVTAFMLLELNESRNEESSNEPVTTLEGTFFVTGKPEDVLFQARTGKVIFERADAVSELKSRRKSGG